MSTVNAANFASVFSCLSSLHHSESATDAFEETIEVATTLFETSVVTLWVNDKETGTFTRAASSGGEAITEPPPRSLRSQLHTDEHHRERESEATASTPQCGFESREPFESELFVTVGRRHVMSIGRRDGDAFDDHDRRIAEGLATTLETTLGRFEPIAPAPADGTTDSRVERRSSETSQQARDADALRRLHEVTGGTRGYDDAVAGVLELGCDHFGLERGILSRIDGADYEIRSARDPSDTFEDGEHLELGETICETTIEAGRSEAVAFADIKATEYRDHPAATAVGAYIAAPIIVDEEPYGTVNFSSETARSARFRSAEREFVTLIAQWLGNEIEQRRRRAELERYETILEAVGDPVYALDTEGRFTFVNEAAQREFGYGDAVIGDTVDVAMAQADVDRVRTQLVELHESDDQSTTAQFELETADGERRIVENRLAAIGDAEFRGSAGVLRDVTGRERRRRRLEGFQQAIEEAVDGVSILDGDEYVYVDQTHVDMYGFDSKDQLLGNTWRQLYDEAEIERLEAEAFPALETDGHWSGRVTGTRPDGSQFPAELSLTTVDDGRLVCTVRDVAEREQRTRQLEEFQRAIESAEDGVAVLDGDEYVYVDQSHVDMYGFDSKDQLLGNTWRRLYDDAEVERLEAEAFPALESDGYWRGMVTGTRPDGSQFPAELSLTIVDDGRLVCTVRDESERQARKRELETRSAAIEAASDGIALLDGDGQYTYVNQAHAGIYGYDSPEAFFGEGWQMCYSDTECARFESDILAQVTEQGEWRGEATGTRQDGTTFHQELSITSLEDGFICVVRDITERRARQQELELKEHAMDEATVGIQIVDATAEDNPLVYVNDGFERMTGYDADDILGENPRVLQGDATDRAMIAKLRDAIDAEQSVSVELQNEREDGTPYWNKLSVTPVRDDEGTVTNYIGIQQDVTDRRRRLEQLEAQRERLDLTLSGTNTGIADWDLTDSTVSWNETLVELVGRDIQTFGEFEKLVHPDDRQRVENQLDRMLETGKPWVGDLRVRCADETYMWLGTRAIPTYDDAGNPVRVLTMATDITDRKQRERQLDRERERFKLLTESIDEYAFVIVDEDGVIQTWNAGASDLFGYDTGTAVGMSMGQLHPESDRESELPDRLLQQARIAGESAHEGRQVRADGSRFYADVRYAPLETDDGEFHGFAMVVRDMTENRRQRRRTERFVEESEDVVTILDPDGTVTYASGSAKGVFGYDPDALVGQNLFDYLHPDGRKYAMETFFNCVEESESVTTECRLKAPDGEWFNIEGRCRNMLDDDAIEGILVYLRDVTGQKERARRFESIFNQTFQFTGLLEPDGTVVEVNDAALEFGGLTREDVVGHPFDEVSWWTHSEMSREAITTALDRAARGNFVRYEANAMGTEGLRTIDFSVKPVLDDDGRVSLLVVEGRDITDQQQRGQHLAVLERVMRHNIRNDLTKLRGWTQMLYEAGDDARREETYGTLQRILDKWEKMTERTQEINQLLDAQALHDSHRSLTAIVDEAVERAHASSADADITIDVDHGANVSVPSVLTDAIDELLSNAVAVSGTEPVTVSCHRPDNTWLELTIDDSGPGLPDAEAAVLESGKETALSHGQGLGLWFVRMVVTEIGGSLSADVRDDGTAITLRIPTKSVDAEVSTDQ